MFKKVLNFLKKQNNFRYIAFGFLAVILLGSGLLMIPGCIKPGVNLHYVDALYTSTSAVCVTGLIAVDTLDTFTLAGQIIIMFLIQIGGLGVTTLGAGLIVAIRRRISLKEKNILQETLNVDDAKGLYYLFKRVFIYTFAIEMAGFLLSLTFFLRSDIMNFYNYGYGNGVFRAVFHSVASFNNSGFDLMGGLRNFTNGPLSNDVTFNIVTALLIILGGIGFIVMSDIRKNIHRLKRTSLHTKIVILMTVILLVSGTLLLGLTERNRLADGSFSWLGAFFTSVSARTAGFSTYNLGQFTKAGQLIVVILMFIGASPGSTGGGIKTTTFFILLLGIKSMVMHKSTNCFKYHINREIVKKAMVITFLALFVVLFGTFIICLIETKTLLMSGRYVFMDVLFEVSSAYGTVGLSTGITTDLSVGSKIVSIIIMYIGRVGPLTFASLWYSGEDKGIGYAETAVPVG